MDSSIFALSIHADYRCRHSGQCCSTDWDVPIEVPVYRSLEAALAEGRLRTSAAAGSLEPFVTGSDLPDDTSAIFQRTDAGVCVFFDSGSHLCVVHRDLGEAALPATCRHFPRVAVRDRRGTFITLSHFCPTAAEMLFREDVPISIVEAPAAFPPAEYEGLVVTDDDLPPLLQPRRLMDFEGYSAWERHMVARCSALDRRPESLIATLIRDARLLREWVPGATALHDAIAALPTGFIDAAAPATLDPSLALFAQAMTAVPDDLRPPADDHDLSAAYLTWVQPPWDLFRAPLNRYVAAKAFATWTAYQGKGVATIVRGLEAALALVRVEAARHCRNAARPLDRVLLLEAFRSADFILNHLAIGEDLADRWSSAEAL